MRPPKHWRIHFHVPLFAADYDRLGSTQSYVADVLRHMLRSAATTHLEIETYTWEVLPGALKLDLLESIAREYEWVLAQAQSRERSSTPNSVALRITTVAARRHAYSWCASPPGALGVVQCFMNKTVVLNVVGLTADLIARGAPRLAEWARGGRIVPIRAAFPAVTCTAQSDYLTGATPTSTASSATAGTCATSARCDSGASPTSWLRAPKIWDTARAEDPAFTCANLFWWFNMYSSADYSVTPRPMYPADGRKLPDVYTAPASLRDDLQRELGTFPLFNFWGPQGVDRVDPLDRGGREAGRAKQRPTLTLVYLPHLDYDLQRVGPHVGRSPSRRSSRSTTSAPI